MTLVLLLASFAQAETPVYKPNPNVKVVYAPDYGQTKQTAVKGPLVAAGAIGVRLGEETRSVTRASIGKDGKVTMTCERFSDLAKKQDKTKQPTQEISHDK